MTDDGQNGYGFVARGKRAAATSIFSGYLHAMGSTWLTASREPAFNADEGVKAFDLYGRMLRLYGPPGSENNHWYEASSIMGQGKAAMYTEFDSISAFVEDPEKSKVKGKIGYVMFPKGPGGKPGTMATVWGLGIPKNSQNPKAAWLFLQWATNKEQVLAITAERAVQGGRMSVWNDPKAKVKMNAELAEALIQGLKVGTKNRKRWLTSESRATWLIDAVEKKLFNLWQSEVKNTTKKLPKDI
jgi:multiple sugar transport system substrate-binding protein